MNTLTLQDVADLAKVRRPVVSMWRKRPIVRGVSRSDPRGRPDMRSPPRRTPNSSQTHRFASLRTAQRPIHVSESAPLTQSKPLTADHRRAQVRAIVDWAGRSTTRCRHWKALVAHGQAQRFHGIVSGKSKKPRPTDEIST